MATKGDILPQDLKISATADDGTIMAVGHKEYSVKDLRKQREQAYKKFIEHYRENNTLNYTSKEMPHTSFADKQFDIILSSHLLFLYDHIFDYDFHKNTIIEMLRICSKEIRIFPLVNLYGKRSPYLTLVLNDPYFKIYAKSIEGVDSEFIRGGHEFLPIQKIQ